MITALTAATAARAHQGVGAPAGRAAAGERIHDADVGTRGKSRSPAMSSRSGAALNNPSDSPDQLGNTLMPTGSGESAAAPNEAPPNAI